jgi:hypothetical protein
MCFQKVGITDGKPKRSPPTKALGDAIPALFESAKIMCYISSYKIFKCIIDDNRVDRFEKSAIFY